MTYAAPLKVTLRLTVFDIEEDTGLKSIRDIKEQDVYMGDMPLMTANGTFVINGTERVIVSQMHRSPGVFFDHDKGKTHSSGKFLFAARVIPYRGSWLDFEFDAKDHAYVRIDRRRKLPATTLLMALDSGETEALRAARAEEGKALLPYEAQGMSKEEILNYFHDTVVYTRIKTGWKTPFVPERMRGQKLIADLVDAKSGDVVAKIGDKITPRLGKKLIDQGMTDQLVQAEDLHGRYLASDIIDETTGEVHYEAGDEIDEAMLEKFAELKFDEVVTLAIDHINTGAYLRNTLAIDRNASREDALIDIYRVMRPGEPPTLESAEKLFNDLFFDNERYDLSAVGRVKMNARLGYETDDQLRVLRKEDILAIVKILLDLKDGRGEIDDIDNLGNRRVRSVGELMENQYRVGLLRMGAGDPRAHELGRYRHRHAARSDQRQAGGGGGARVLRLVPAQPVHGPDQPAVGDHPQAAPVGARPGRPDPRAGRLRGARRAPDPLRPDLPDRDAGRPEYRPDQLPGDLCAGEQVRLHREPVPQDRGRLRDQ